ncbi:MAG: Tad domain-containing protein [Alphaproteobacteria bacterium]|nr:Tad domain-containing protein [Alphaproteobacteria bacterium]
MIDREKYDKTIALLVDQFVRSRSGSVLPIVALALPVIIGVAGLGADASMWMAKKRNLQQAADSAILAAGWELAQGTAGNMNSAATKEAAKNGYEPEENGELLLQYIRDEDGGAVWGVTLSQDADVYFTKIFSDNPVHVTAYAEAFVGGVEGDFCILALDPTADGAFSTSGSVIVNAPSCGIAANSTSDNAFDLGGSSSVTINDVRVSGGYEVGSNVDFEYGQLRAHQSPLKNPYEDLEIPSFSGCDEHNKHVTSSTTLSPGVYCGGISVSGNNDVHFEPGVYILDGGDFKVTGGGELIGEGVTFILTGNGNNYAGLDISGSRYVQFSAPEAGNDWAGITFFQDPDAPDRDNLQNKLLGSSGVVFDGVAYFPSQGLSFGGNDTTTAGVDPCTRLIARTVTLSGNPMMGNNCTKYDVKDIGLPRVKLVL